MPDRNRFTRSEPISIADFRCSIVPFDGEPEKRPPVRIDQAWVEQFILEKRKLIEQIKVVARMELYGIIALEAGEGLEPGARKAYVSRHLRHKLETRTGMKLVIL